MVTGEVDYSWDDNSQDSNTSIDDKAVLVIYNPLHDHAVTVIGGSTRESGMHSIILPDLFSGESVECYIAFTDANKSVVSNSQWIARITVA